MPADLVIAIILVLFSAVLGQDCTLDDAQSTRGTCRPIRNCTFAIKNLYADIKPKLCSGKMVCCPTQDTIAERKCREWRSYLHTPLHFDVVPLPEPLCPNIPMSFLPGSGKYPEKFEFPHAVALGYGEIETELRYLCGGTLISDEYILTAAHCIRSSIGSPTFVLIGDITLDRPTSNFRQIIPINETIVHPDYKPPLVYNDIALLKLKDKVELSRYLLPACLPRPGLTESEFVEAVGWGALGPGEPQSQTLQTVNLTIFSKNDCELFYSDSATKESRFPDGLRRTQMCAGDKEMSGKDTCNGDGGGPLTQNELHKGKELRCLFRVVGITSFGFYVCGNGTPGIYTKVLSYVPWIEHIVFGAT